MAARTWSFLDPLQVSEAFATHAVSLARPASFGAVFMLNANIDFDLIFGFATTQGGAFIGLSNNFVRATFNGDPTPTLTEDKVTPLGQLVHAHVNMPADGDGDAELWINGFLAGHFTQDWTVETQPTGVAAFLALPFAGLYVKSATMDDFDIAVLFANICHQKDIPDVFNVEGMLDYVWSVKRGNAFGKSAPWMSSGSATPIGLTFTGSETLSVSAVEELPFFTPAGTTLSPS